MTRAALEYNSRQLLTQFNRRPFYVRHNLVGHPLLQIPRLLDLVKALPADYLEYASGEQLLDQKPELTPRNGLTAEETVARIRDNKSWMVIKFIETDPEYKALLDTLLDPLIAETAKIAPRAGRRYGFIFVSSPGSVTPYHMDGEHNFLLQVQGTKTMHVWSPDDRYVCSEEQLETFYVGGVHRNMKYDESYEASAYQLQLSPGVGLHVPVTSPHHVKVGPEVSVSLSITYRSMVSDRAAFLYRTNARLRKRGLHPAPVGSHPLLENALYRSSRAWHMLKGDADREPV
jgi:hypothetical protein